MKLYYAPLACSLADHIALLEAGLSFETERVDLKTRLTASGADFWGINPKGYVPALRLDSGEIITENVAMLDWIAQHSPTLGPTDGFGRTRQLEALAFIATELHPNFKPMWHHGNESEKSAALTKLVARFEFLASAMLGRYLFGDTPGVADFYLYVMLRWAGKFGVPLSGKLILLRDRITRRPSVKAALDAEGWGPETDAPRSSADVIENEAGKRFERRLDGERIAAAYYAPGPEGRLRFIHTEVPPEYSGQGIATELAIGAFELLRQTGRRAILICPFMIHFYQNHPEYRDVVEA